MLANAVAVLSLFAIANVALCGNACLVKPCDLPPQEPVHSCGKAPKKSHAPATPEKSCEHQPSVAASERVSANVSDTVVLLPFTLTNASIVVAQPFGATLPEHSPPRGPVRSIVDTTVLRI